ncbi:uncharacterized protein TM35_000021480, partial [Trypanosoma theileri]
RERERLREHIGRNAFFSFNFFFVLRDHRSLWRFFPILEISAQHVFAEGKKILYYLLLSVDASAHELGGEKSLNNLLGTCIHPECTHPRGAGKCEIYIRTVGVTTVAGTVTLRLHFIGELCKSYGVGFFLFTFLGKRKCTAVCVWG